MKKLNSGYWKMNTSHWKDAYLALKFARAIETCCVERFSVKRSRLSVAGNGHRPSCSVSRWGRTEKLLVGVSNHVCKSHHEFGVEQAQAQCVQTYLMRILELAKARVIVVLGARARQVIQREFEIPPEKLLSESIEIGGNQRLFTFLPHPNARANRSFAKCLQNDELERLRASLRHNQ